MVYQKVVSLNISSSKLYHQHYSRLCRMCGIFRQQEARP